MSEPTDPTGAWIDHLQEANGQERVNRLSFMSEHEKDAALLRLLVENERARGLRGSLRAIIARVDEAIAELSAVGNEAQQALEVDGG
jgi:hypothetical protein